ncbi:hypothetical protein SAMN05216232_1775 [Virgibacillus subterraneus]|uniref:DUF3679 domain-containing protein n=1 Tax=Virgibacillus subterraneus TaxID=621109 RepID=A0A1H9DUN5_9BACI|nr:hypothetical protein [Virgibacillus subterraneus]SEQ17199.1 hypothetical protein SAMN05216232_1775 [Virgibacillus subterraneus]
MRSLVVLLLLALFFLVGIVVGLDRGESATDPMTENTVRTEEVEEKQVVVVEQTTSENIMTAEAPVQFTQKIAKFLEASVQGFYEIIVEVIYQIVQVFF